MNDYPLFFFLPLMSEQINETLVKDWLSMDPQELVMFLLQPLGKGFGMAIYFCNDYKISHLESMLMAACYPWPETLFVKTCVVLLNPWSSDAASNSM